MLLTPWLLPSAQLASTYDPALRGGAAHIIQGPLHELAIKKMPPQICS